MEWNTLPRISNYESVISSPDESDELLPKTINSIVKRSASDGNNTMVQIDEERDKIDTIPLQMFDYREKTKNIQSLMKGFSNSVVIVDSYYDSIEEYHGIVESINYENNEFKASLRPINDESNSNIISAIFDIDDIQESDKKLLVEGAQIIWLLGKERKINNVKGIYKLGGITNISKIQLRRTRVLNKVQRRRIEEQANEWSRFFGKLE